MCAKDCVHEPFAMINADDFYGRDAFVRAYNYLSNIDKNSNNYGMIGYKTANTLTENGSVKRGICETKDNGYLIKITESKVHRENGTIIAEPLSGDKAFTVSDDTTVSMNFLLFTPTIFNYIEELFPKFFEDNKDNLLTSEYLIPEVLSSLIVSGKASCKVSLTTANWYGVTYKEDTPSVKNAIKDLIANGEYEENIWK